jgi:Fe-S-cluster-containing hydrogenase component 2
VAEIAQQTRSPVSARIAHHPQTCTGCGLCDLMCSLYHEGEQGQPLSRGMLVGDRLTAEFTFHVCRQCVSPNCYEACPLQDRALCIDQATGATYINREHCDGCGACIEACPFDPPRIKLHPHMSVAFMCDLCREREAGPICIEYCNFDSLTLESRDGR